MTTPLASLSEVSRLFQVFCPLSMTDGAARTIELIGNQEAKNDILPRLIR